LKKHISTLASDAYEGREPGTHGEEMARDYIAGKFKELGLKAKGTKGYVQEFDFTEGANLGAGNQLYIKFRNLSLR
jgi:hypothetical protein